jgi:hypothetical protein
MQNVLTKVEGAATTSTNDPEEVDLGIEFPLKTMTDLDSLEGQLESSETSAILVCRVISITKLLNNHDDIDACMVNFISLIRIVIFRLENCLSLEEIV